MRILRHEITKIVPTKFHLWFCCRAKRLRNYFKNWRSRKLLSDRRMSSRPCFSLGMKSSLSSHKECCKIFLEKTICHHLQIHDTTRKPFFLNRFLVLARIPSKMWLISTYFLDVFVLIVLVLIHLCRPVFFLTFPFIY